MSRQPVERRRIAVAAVLILAGVLTWRLRDDDPLVRLGSDARALEARLTVFPPAPTSIRGSSEKSISGRQFEAMGELMAQVERQRTPENLHRLALAQLALGMSEQAHQLLAEARDLQPQSAAMASDLAAAQLSLGRIADAAETSSLALQHDPKSAAAAFNWALALEKLFNRAAAIQAWQRYLALEPSGAWSEAARERMAQLRQPRPTWDEDKLLLVPGADAATIRGVHARYPQRVRTRVQNILLPKWLIDGGDAADLALLRSIAAERKAAGDRYLHEAVEHAEARRTELMSAAREFSAAFAARRGSRYADAASHYRNAADLFARSGSPLRFAASIAAAENEAYLENPRYDVVLSRIERIERELAAAGGRYPGLAAEAAWMRGFVLMQTGDAKGCLEAYRRALIEARRAGESENEIAIGHLVATQLELVGDPEEADRARLDILRRCDEINAHPERMYTALADSAFTALRQGRPRLALAFNESQLQIAETLRDPLLIAESQVQRAISLLEVGDIHGAGVEVGSARAYALLVPRDGLRERVLAEVEYTNGRIDQRRGDASRAASAFSLALERWERNRWHIHLARGYLARAEAFLAANDRPAAERDLRAGVAEMEARRNLTEPAMRVAYFERADRVFERLIELLSDDGRAEDALSISERKRARFLLDQIAGTDAATPLEAEAIAAAVGGRTALIEVTLLERGAEIWLLHRGRVLHARSAAPRAELETAVARHLSAIAANDVAGSRREGRWLFDQLLGPIASHLPSEADLVIIPDGSLQAFPFATLVMADGRYLVEQYALAMAPSATIFLRAPSGTPKGSVLAVAQPAPQGYDTLPTAAAEAREIAALYPGGEIFTSSQMGPEDFLDRAQDAALVHFAGHSAADLRRPSASALIFESQGGQPIALTAETIGRSRLAAHPLVVLAGCGTARGKVLRNEGIPSLAAAFLQAGARGVVATLWNIDDAASTRLFRTFHRKLRDGARPADALRDAQRSLLNSGDPRDRSPSTWGSAVVVGTL